MSLAKDAIKTARKTPLAKLRGLRIPDPVPRPMVCFVSTFITSFVERRGFILICNLSVMGHKACRSDPLHGIHIRNQQAFLFCL